MNPIIKVEQGSRINQLIWISTVIRALHFEDFTKYFHLQHLKTKHYFKVGFYFQSLDFAAGLEL